MRRRSLALLTALALCFPAVAAANRPGGSTPQCADDNNRFSRTSEPGPYAALASEITVIPSPADGTPIQIGVIRPDTAERVPVILEASPYFFGGMDGDVSQCQRRLTENYVAHGYAVAFVPVRGTADSGACFDLYGPSERADLDAAVTWLGTRPWSNGNVGMIGVSYPGGTPWAVAATGNPHLKTIVPISGVNDPFDLMYAGGVKEDRGAAILNTLYYEYGFVEYNPVEGNRGAERVVSGAACPEMIEGEAAAAYAYATGERDPMGFWEERNPRPHVESNYRGSVFMIQGLQDWNVDPGHQFPWINRLQEAGTPVKYLLGQWGHAWPDSTGNGARRMRADFADVLLAWWDRWLKEDLSSDTGPGAEVQDAFWEWRAEESWPPPDATPQTLYLASGTLSDAAPSETRSVVVNAPAGPDLIECQACAVYRLTPGADVRIAGLPEVRVRVTPTAADGHLSATLFLGQRTGGPATIWNRVGWGAASLRFPEGGEHASPVTPGVPIDLVVRFQPLDAIVPAGMPLTLVLHTGPPDALNKSAAGAPAPVIVEEGASARLILPVIDRG